MCAEPVKSLLQTSMKQTLYQKLIHIFSRVSVGNKFVTIGQVGEARGGVSQNSIIIRRVFFFAMCPASNLKPISMIMLLNCSM